MLRGKCILICTLRIQNAAVSPKKSIYHSLNAMKYVLIYFHIFRFSSEHFVVLRKEYKIFCFQIRLYALISL